MEGQDLALQRSNHIDAEVCQLLPTSSGKQEIKVIGYLANNLIGAANAAISETLADI